MNITPEEQSAVDFINRFSWNQDAGIAMNGIVFVVPAPLRDRFSAALVKLGVIADFTNKAKDNVFGIVSGPSHLKRLTGFSVKAARDMEAILNANPVMNVKMRLEAHEQATLGKLEQHGWCLNRQDLSIEAQPLPGSVFIAGNPQDWMKDIQALVNQLGLPGDIKQYFELPLSGNPIKLKKPLVDALRIIGFEPKIVLNQATAPTPVVTAIAPGISLAVDKLRGWDWQPSSEPGFAFELQYSLSDRDAAKGVLLALKDAGANKTDTNPDNHKNKKGEYVPRILYADMPALRGNNFHPDGRGRT